MKQRRAASVVFLFVQQRVGLVVVFLRSLRSLLLLPIGQRQSILCQIRSKRVNVQPLLDANVEIQNRSQDNKKRHPPTLVNKRRRNVKDEL